MGNETILDRLKLFTWTMLKIGFSVGLQVKKLVETLIALVGPVFVTAGTVLITFCSALHISFFLPYYHSQWTILAIGHYALSALAIFSILYNYHMVVFTHPGKTPDPTDVEKELVEELKRAPTPKKGQGFSKYCKTCKKPKVPRSHHCHVCGECILRMDHHCPWVGTCVGHHNHRYFTLFLVWLWLGCLWLMAETSVPFHQVTSYRAPWFRGIASRATLSFVFVLTSSVSIAVGILLFWHLYLAVSNQTTIEFYYNKYKYAEAKVRGGTWDNEYHLGYRQNWSHFFGEGKTFLSWLLPSLWSAPYGNGFEYPTSSGAVGGRPIHFGEKFLDDYL